MNRLQTELNKLEQDRSRALSAGVPTVLGERGSPVSRQAAKDLRRDISRKTQEIMSTAGKLVDLRAKSFMADSQAAVTYREAVTHVLANDPALKRAYAEGQ
ncbi:MAG: hypothetical protein ACREXY_16965 [Gammaproteobacteria bacterium]